MKKGPKDTLIYEIYGPMIFGATDKFVNMTLDSGIKVIILRMRSVPAMDDNALYTLNNVYSVCHKKQISLLLSHVQEQPLQMMKKAGFVKQIGEENFCDNIDQALERAHLLQIKEKFLNM